MFTKLTKLTNFKRCPCGVCGEVKTEMAHEWSLREVLDETVEEEESRGYPESGQRVYAQIRSLLDDH